MPKQVLPFRKPPAIPLVVLSLSALLLSYSFICAQEESSPPVAFPRPWDLVKSQWSLRPPETPLASIRAGTPPALRPEMAGLLPLTLREAIRIAVDGNYDLQAQSLLPRIAQLEVSKAKGVFDTYLTASYTHDYASELTSSQLQGTSANLLKTRRIVSDLGLAKTVDTGARVDLKLDLTRTGSNSTFLVLNPSYTTHLNLSIAQPLLKNGGLAFQRTPIRIAEYRRLTSENQWRGAVADVVLEVEQAYWDLVFAFENLDVRRRSLDLARQLLQENEARVRLGNLAPVEVLQSRTGVSLREEELLDAQNLLESAQDRLKGLLQWNRAPTGSQTWIQPVETPRDPPEEEQDLLEESLETALRSRPEFLAARKELEAKHLEIRLAENQLLPSLDLTGRIGLNGLAGSAVESTDFFALSRLSELERILVGLGLIEPPTATSPLNGTWRRSFRELADTDSYQWGVGLRFEMPLENRTAKSGYLQAKLEAYRSLCTLRSLAEKITLEVREAWRAMGTQREKIRTSLATENFARQQFEAEQKRLALGLSTNYQLLQMEADLRTAQINTLRAKIEYWKARARLEKAKGSLLEKEGIRIEEMPSSGSG